MDTLSPANLLERAFIEYQVPKIIDALRRIAEATERQSAVSGRPLPPCELCHVCVHYNGGEYSVPCSGCLISGHWDRFPHIKTRKEKAV